MHMPGTMMGPTLALRIDATGARQGAQQFDDAADRIAAGGKRIDASLRGVEGSFEPLKASAASSRVAMASFVGARRRQPRGRMI
jgi:hypothetical protein